MISMGSIRPRQFFVKIHRWVGLAIAAPLVIVALTGSLLAFNDELEAIINPQLFLIEPPASDAKQLDPLVLRDIVSKRYPTEEFNAIWLTAKPGHSVAFSNKGVANDQIFVDPYSGEVLGERKWGDISQGIKNVMPFLYRLHFAFALDEIGRIILGILALVWTLDCFVGLYLTFPANQIQRKKLISSLEKNWISRWKFSWKLRFHASKFKFIFDLHRAGALWVWFVLFVIAWSSVSFNLSEVYQPVMSSVFDNQVNPRKLPKQTTPESAPPMDWVKARETGRRLMAEEAEKHNFKIIREDWMFYDSARRFYRYDVVSSLDLNQHNGNTRLFFDSVTGDFKYIWLPTSKANGDTLTSWITSIHTAAMWGMPMKFFISFMGLTTITLIITGVLIWLRKRNSHKILRYKALNSRVNIVQS